MPTLLTVYHQHLLLCLRHQLISLLFSLSIPSLVTASTMLSSAESIYATQLAVFAALNLPAAFVMFKHGTASLSGWLFVWLFCCIRIVGAGIQIKSDLDHTVSEAGTIIYNVAIAPLVFAMSGLISEASVSVSHRHPRLLGRHLSTLMHLLVIAGLALIITGAVNIISALESGQPEDPTYLHLVQGGVSIFLVLVVLIAGLAVYSLSQPRNLRGEKLLITAVVACCPLLAMRILYSFLGAVINDASWSFLTGGTIAEQVVLDVVPEFLIIIILVTVGFATRNLSKERRTVNTARLQPEEYSLVGQVPKNSNTYT